MQVTSPLKGVGGGPEADETVRRAVLSGKAVLVGGDGTFLGRVSAEAHHTGSIWNPLGPHGSPHSNVSLFDVRSPYGRETSYLSHRDPQATKPPQLQLNDKPVAHLTTNPSLEPRLSLETLVSHLRNRQ